MTPISSATGRIILGRPSPIRSYASSYVSSILVFSGLLTGAWAICALLFLARIF